MLHIIKEEHTDEGSLGAGIRHACATARARACACTHGEAKGGRGADALLAQRAHGAPAQKVHCIYKSFIMNYTMVYLKWEACLVRGYMGYRDYNACSEEGAKGGNTRLQGASNLRGNRTISCRCSLSRAHALPTCAHAHTIRACAHASIQIDIAGRMPTPE